MAFSVTLTGGKLKSEPDRESLKADWYPVDSLLTASGKPTSADSGRIPLRCRDFLVIVTEALKFHEWSKKAKMHCEQIPSSIDRFRPVLNQNEQQPGLFIEFCIVHQSSITKKIECLVHQSIETDTQLLQNPCDGFPVVEFGFEFFFPMVVSKCYRHILQDGHQSIEIPEAVIGVWCLPVPRETLRQGLRLRILCRHKRSSSKAEILVPARYHWIPLESEEVLASLYMLTDQFRPRVIML